MLNLFILNTKKFNNLKSVFFLDVYLSKFVSFSIIKYINIFSLLVLEKYILDFLFRKMLVNLYSSIVHTVYFIEVNSLLSYSFILSNISLLYWLV